MLKSNKFLISLLNHIYFSTYPEYFLYFILLPIQNLYSRIIICSVDLLFPINYRIFHPKVLCLFFSAAFVLLITSVPPLYHLFITCKHWEVALYWLFLSIDFLISWHQILFLFTDFQSIYLIFTNHNFFEFQTIQKIFMFHCFWTPIFFFALIQLYLFLFNFKSFQVHLVRGLVLLSILLNFLSPPHIRLSSGSQK